VPRGKLFEVPPSFPTSRKEFVKALLYEKASWRDMFPVVPPIRDVDVEWRMSGPSFPGDMRRVEKVIFDELDENDGLRMGLLFDICEEWKGPDKHLGFGIEWMCDGDENVDPNVKLDRSM
tara:strand:- start:15970 stop:16329 length:360 start_codon:yes stop_codon:yes gene_type:complete